MTCAVIVIVIGFVLSFCSFGLIFALSVYYQFVQGHSAVETGLAFVPFAVAITAANLVGSAIAARVGPARTIVGALMAAALGYALLLRMEPSSKYFHMLPAQIVARLGIGAAIPLTTSMLLAAASKVQTGIASAGLNAVRQAGAAIGVAVFGALMNSNPVSGFEVAVGLAAGLLLAAVATSAVFLRPA